MNSTGLVTFINNVLGWRAIQRRKQALPSSTCLFEKEKEESEGEEGRGKEEKEEEEEEEEEGEEETAIVRWQKQIQEVSFWVI